MSEVFVFIKIEMTLELWRLVQVRCTRHKQVRRRIQVTPSTSGLVSDVTTCYCIGTCKHVSDV